MQKARDAKIVSVLSGRQAVVASTVLILLVMILGQALSSVSNDRKIMRIGNQAFRIDIADTPVKRALGLSVRAGMKANEGMLFVFGGSSQQCMWMKDMRFDLDMVWLDNRKMINHIESHLSPRTYPQSFCGNGAAAYVIELNSGSAGKLDLQLGQKIDI